MKNAIQWKFIISLGLVLIPVLGGCDEQTEEVFLDAEEVSSRGGTVDKKSWHTLEEARVKWKMTVDRWLKINPDSTEGGGGCYMDESWGESGTYFLFGYCCEDLDVEKTCELLFVQVCIPHLGCTED